MDDRISFFQAIKDGDTNTVLSFLGRRNRVFYTHSHDHQRRSPLDIALENVINRDIIQYLLDAGVIISFDNILFAAGLRSHEILRMLCSSGRGQGHPNQPNKNGWNPLQFAISRFNRLSIINALLDNGADPNMSRPFTALYMAVLFRSEPSIIRALILAGADPNIRDCNGNTVVHQAYEADCNNSTIKCIAENGGNVNLHDSKGQTILMNALQRNSDHFIRWVVNNLRVDCNVPAIGSNRTALHFYARRHENLYFFNLSPQILSRALDQSIFVTLIRAGANVNVLDSMGTTPLYHAAQEGNDQAVRALLKAGADPNLSDANRRFPLHIAVTRQQNGIVEILRRAGADVNAPDVEGSTPLHLAVRMHGGYTAVINLIDHLNCNPNATDNRGRTALHEAAIKGDSFHMVFILRHSRVDPNIQDENDMTPLHHAVLSPNNYSSAMFLAPRTDMSIRDRFGKTALYYALLRKAPVDLIYFLIRQQPAQFRFH